METKQLIEEIFENPESINQIFIEYFENKNYDFEPAEEIIEIEIYTDYFENPALIGKLELENNKLQFFTIKVKDNLSEKSSKKRQYELAIELLKLTYADAGIFIFYDNEGNFRFSFIYSKYTDTKREFSHYKRYTYFVSKNQPNRTFIKQLDLADFTSIENIKQAFSLKQLTKEFYKEIQNWYAYALKLLNENKATYPGGKNEENLIRLITRIIFVWFLKERKLIPEDIFDESKLKDIVKDFKQTDNYYNAILQNLFFATLNRKPDERAFAEEGNFYQNKKHFGIKTLYRYSDKLLISKEEFINLLKQVPFINGGLFECLDKDKEYIDGFSRNEKKRAKLPDYLFFSEEKDIDLSFFYGNNRKEKVRGLINILKEYNFTADENSPIDVEVSLDPELLGHIFENLLASFNPETKTTARKSTGSYYTPKEIVDFMVNESLILYFKTKTNIKEEKLRDLLSYSQKNDLTEEEKQKLIDEIDNIKILDPAVGSGAFPMGILHKLVHILHKLDPDNKLWKQKQIEKLEKTKKEVLSIQDIKTREQLLENIEQQKEDIEKAFQNEIDYSRKLFLIENSIYGVDIQPIAIQIAKLRFFLSLLIDQKIDKNQENYGILPLPNLETKFVSANTLIKLERPTQISVFKTEIIRQLEEEYKELMKNYFTASNRGQKKKLQEKAKQIKEKLVKELKEVGFEDETIKKIISFDIFDQLSSADWFDPEWMFGLTEGFDIIIGNPPYIQLQKDGGKLANLYKNKGYETFVRTGDIYTLFYERGLELLKQNRILAFITSNKWMRAKYGEKLRNFFLKYNPLILVDLGPDIFESATVDTNILIIQKSKNQNKLKAVNYYNRKQSIEETLKKDGIILEKLTKDAWFIGDKLEIALKEKIEKIGKPLKEWNVNIYRGVLTGLNKAFIIDTETRNKILENCKTKEERERTEKIIKPILRGRDIKRYYYEWANLWVIFIPWHFPLHNNKEIQGASKKSELEFKKQYPTIYNHLLKFKEKLSNRNKEETGIRYEWYALQRCAATYYQEFEKEKIVWNRITNKVIYSYVDKGFYVLDSTFFITGKNLKYIIAILNSKISLNWMSQSLATLGRGMYGAKIYVEKLPIPPITKSNENIVSEIENLVDKILKTKKPNPKADTTDLENQIDNLVYKLYNLTEEEIKIINSS